VVTKIFGRIILSVKQNNYILIIYLTIKPKIQNSIWGTESEVINSLKCILILEGALKLEI